MTEMPREIYCYKRKNEQWSGSWADDVQSACLGAALSEGTEPVGYIRKDAMDDIRRCAELEKAKNDD